jgi:hypothetical protein
MPARDDVQSRQRLVTAHTRALLLLAHNTMSRAAVFGSGHGPQEFPRVLRPFLVYSTYRT